MLQNQTPIGKFITLFYDEGDRLLPSGILKDKIENLVDLIKFRTKEKGIDYSSKSLQDELFDVKIELLKFFASDPDFLEKYQDVIIDHISNKYSLPKKHQKLGYLVADTLEVYFKFFSGVKELFKTSIENLSSLSIQLPTWQGLKSLQVLQPNKELNDFIVWNESSLNYDYSLIVSEFIFSDKIFLSTVEVHELEKLMKKSIEDFGAYSIISRMWEPSEDDESQIIRNIKIKAAIMELENDKGSYLYIDDFGKLINK